MAEQAAYLTKKALLLREGVTPALVLHAAAEQLEDTMIRSGDSEREFKRLARSYRDEIWPGVFGEIDAANARVAAVVRARDALVATLAEETACARPYPRIPEVTVDGELVFRIGLVGPSRVGKTSLITALLRDSQRLLQGTPVSLRPLGTATEKRIAQHRRELDGSLLAGEFTPGALRGTEEPFTFQLLLDSGVRGTGIRLELLDYPGGWLDPATRPHDRDGDWQACQRFLQQCSVLLVPVDAAVLMEPTSARNCARCRRSSPRPRSARSCASGSRNATGARTSRRC